MNYVERTLSFECAGESLLGIVSAPAESQVQAETGVVIIVGGPQYRAGSHRQFVLLARALAEAGFPVLRFDYRGMGDSTGDCRTFEDIDEDVASAISALQAASGVKSAVLWGLCDGASAALLYLHARPDPRVAGIALINPWVRTQAGLARTFAKHYYWKRLREREFWAKLFRGKLATSAALDLVRNLRALVRVPSSRSQPDTQDGFQDRMALALGQFTGPTLILLSENDLTAQEFSDYTAKHPAWSGSLGRSLVERHPIPGADHTFTSHRAMRLVIGRSVAWMHSISRASSGVN